MNKYLKERKKERKRHENSLLVQQLGLGAFTANGPGTICGQGTTILQATQYSQKKGIQCIFQTRVYLPYHQCLPIWSKGIFKFCFHFSVNGTYKTEGKLYQEWRIAVKVENLSTK